MNSLLIVLLLPLAFIQLPQPDLRPVYDGRSLSVAPPPREKLAAAQAIFEREILPVARRHWGDETGRCDQNANNFMIIDVAKGSFTRPGANQDAILYKYCETAHNFALDGLAIIEDVRVVGHVAYEGAWDAAMATLPDINGNGLSEIIIDRRGMNMGEGWATISIIEFSGNTVRKFGATETETYTCGANSDQRSEAYMIYAKPGKTPVFYRETFVQDCKRNAPWRKSGTLRRIFLKESDIEYQRLR